VEDDLIVMTLGFNSKGVNKSFISKKYRYSSNDSTKMIDVIDRMTLDAAIFVLKQYDPLVTLLMDYNPEVIYSSSVNQWHENVYDEEERLLILKELSARGKKGDELVIWSHAVTGALYSEKYEQVEYDKYLRYAILHFEKTIEMDPSFIDIVGSDLARIYSNVKDTASEIKTYRQMIESDPGNLNVHNQLLKIYSKRNNSNDYYKTLESAFQHGLHIPAPQVNRPQFRKYKDEDRFKALLAKYNEANKPIF
jgi:tetratricopeptide (TPR) repeat protein